MEIRRLKAAEMEQAIRLSDSIFREPGHTSMGEAFPQVFTQNEIHSFGAFDGKQLVSFIGLVPSSIKLGATSLNVFLLGSVCTDVAYRGKGISTAMLKEIYEYIETAQGTLLFVSGDRGMYVRNHCYHFGKTNQYIMSKVNLESVAYAGLIREGQTTDVFSVNELRKAADIRFETSIGEWASLFHAGGLVSISKKQQQLFVAEKDGEIEAYVVVGLANDMKVTEQAFVTEWGGDPDSVHAILAEIIKNGFASEIMLLIPWYEKLNKSLTTYFTKTDPHGGTVYIINAEKLGEQLLPYIGSKVASENKFKMKQIDEEAFQIFYGNEMQTVTQEELVALLFSPDTEVENKQLKSVLPIPLPSPDGMYFV